MNDWAGQTVVILASGPSLTAAQCEHVRDWHAAGGGKAIVINSTYKSALWADVLYACDWRLWWQYNLHEVTKSFSGQLWTQFEVGTISAKAELAHRSALARHRINIINLRRFDGLSRDPSYINHGGSEGARRASGNSGYQAINLAYHWGVSRMVLLGFDMKLGQNKQKNHHAQHVIHVDSPYESWIRTGRPLAADLASVGVTVLNATPDSALDCFPKVDLEEALGARTVLAA